MTPAELLAVPGVPESALDEAVAGSLPASAPEGPWACDSTAVVWVTRAGAARAVLGALLPGGTPVAVVGGMVSYRRTPVGAYREVFGGVGLRTGRRVGVTIPFMAVDSRDSLVGGRQNWSLPKVLAEFDGEPGAGAAMTAAGGGWTVRVSARPLGPRLPVRTGGRLVQRWPDGVLRSALLTGRARSRPALVTVEVSSAGELPSWLRPGRHLGALMTDVRFTLPGATP